MSKLKRQLTTAALGACAALLLLPALGQAATEFGSRLENEPANSGECEPLGPCTIVSFIHPSDPNGDPYSGGAPVDGVIVKFRIRAFVPEAAPVTFRLADISRPDPNDDESAVATAAGTGPTVVLQTTEDGETPIREFAGRLSVKKGQHLAIDGTNVHATVNNSGDDFSYVFTPPLLDGSGAQGSQQSTGELLVAAVIEPDADKDGFGDETQDQCPSQATTQGPCDVAAPGVTGLGVKGNKVSYTLNEAAAVSLRLEKRLPGRRVGKKCVPQTAKNKGRKKCSRFKAIGSAFAGPGAAGANRVALPGKKLAPGGYRVTITARDAAGNQTVKSVSFTVAKKKKTS